MKVASFVEHSVTLFFVSLGGLLVLRAFYPSMILALIMLSVLSIAKYRDYERDRMFDALGCAFIGLAFFEKFYGYGETFFLDCLVYYLVAVVITKLLGKRLGRR